MMWSGSAIEESDPWTPDVRLRDSDEVIQVDRTLFGPQKVSCHSSSIKRVPVPKSGSGQCWQGVRTSNY